MQREPQSIYPPVEAITLEESRHINNLKEGDSLFALVTAIDNRYIYPPRMYGTWESFALSLLAELGLSTLDKISQENKQRLSTLIFNAYEELDHTIDNT